MKVWKYLAIILVLLSSTSGCAASKTITKEDRNKVMDAYFQALSSARSDAIEFIRQNLKVDQAFGYVRPYVPVVLPADVRLVWIPAHKSKEDADTLVSGHWVYIMARQSRWFIDAQSSDKLGIPLVIPYKQSNKK